MLFDSLAIRAFGPISNGHEFPTGEGVGGIAVRFAEGAGGIEQHIHGVEHDQHRLWRKLRKHGL